MVIPGPGLPRLGSLVEIMANRSPFGSHEKSSTVSAISYKKTRQRLCQQVELTLKLHYLNRIVLLPHTEDLKVAEDGLLGLRVPVNLDTQEVALILPVEFTL
jgi:hypothetical protein